MAHYINKLIDKNEKEVQNFVEKYLVIAGKGHLEKFCGVHEIVFNTNHSL